LPLRATGIATMSLDRARPHRRVARASTVVKSWLRKIAGVFSSRRDTQPFALDDWRAEDHQPVAEPDAVPDPWHSEMPPGLADRTPPDPPSREAAAAVANAGAITPDAQPAGATPPPPIALRPIPGSEQAKGSDTAVFLVESWGEAAFATAPWPSPGLELSPEALGDRCAHRADADQDGPDLLPHGFDLPDYDPTLDQRLGSEAWEVFDPAQAQAREKAVMIAALLEVTTRRELDDATALLEALFLERRRPSTFKALERAAREGLDLATLRDMAELRALWAQHPEWWACRSFSRSVRNGATSLSQLPNGATALSWALARRVCLARADYPVEQMIDPDWLGEWRRLPPSAGTPVSFVDYLAEKLEFGVAEQLDAGFDFLDRAGRPDEPHDHHGWAKALRDPTDGQPLSLRMADVLGPRARPEADATRDNHV
jgi:hypothetical protein